MPVRFATLFRGLILLAIIGHVLFMYGTARVFGGTIGFSWDTSLIAAGFALALVVPLFFAAGLPELPEVIAHRKAERRWKRGLCVNCGYDLEGFAASAQPRCPECGARIADPGSYQLSWHTLQRFAIMVVIGWLMGCIAGESHLLLDEWRFEQQVEVHASVGPDFALVRPRAWPFTGSSLYHLPEHGVTIAN